MSTTTDPAVAVGYAIRKGVTNGALLMKMKTTNNLQRGAGVKWVSMFQEEEEVVFPPLTFMQVCVCVCVCVYVCACVCMYVCIK
jgi:hypothetical protein